MSSTQHKHKPLTQTDRKHNVDNQRQRACGAEISHITQPLADHPQFYTDFIQNYSALVRSFSWENNL